jgi:hypothetical protein
MKHEIKLMKQIFSHSSLVSINGINCYIIKMFVNKVMVSQVYVLLHWILDNSLNDV